jgi:UDP-N-acetyl-2-amino-2-deoxyglucuronate dehydrogenase
MKDLNFGLIGCGKIAEKHAKLLAGIDGANLIAVADTDKDRAQRLGQIYSIPSYTDFTEMLTTEPVDVANILTPSGTHAQIGVEVAKLNKHMIIEKPLALTMEDADAVLKACEENRVKIFVVKQNRYNLPVQQLRGALDNGRFGRLVLGTVRVRWSRRQEYYDRDAWRGTWALDGGVLANQASHHIDLLQWMMGPVDSVVAKAGTMLVDIEAEDLALAIIKFRNGALGVVEATTCARPVDLEGSLSVLGERGSVEISGFAVDNLRTWNFEDPSPDDEDIISKYARNPRNIYGYAHIKFFEDVIDCIRHDRDGSITGSEARKALKLVTALYESIETGKEIFLERFVPRRSKLGKTNERP